MLIYLYTKYVEITRKGENLWNEWIGEGYSPMVFHSVVYYTVGHVSIENDVVHRGLASAVQRDGLADGLGQAYKQIHEATQNYGWAGEIDGSYDLTVCDKNGETIYGDVVDEVLPITWVEVYSIV